LGRLLRNAEEQGIVLERNKDTYACSSSNFNTVFEDVRMDAPVCLSAFADIHAVDEIRLTAVLILRNGKFANGLRNAKLEERVQKVSNLLDDVNELFANTEYQVNVRNCIDRRSVIKMARSVQYEVLPKYGFTANEKGTVVMAMFTSSAALGPGMHEKIERSMRLSYVGQVGHLPYKASLPRLDEEDSSLGKYPFISLSSDAPMAEKWAKLEEADYMSSQQHRSAERLMSAAMAAGSNRGDVASLAQQDFLLRFGLGPPGGFNNVCTEAAEDKVVRRTPTGYHETMHSDTGSELSWA
jgi:hypothetical protein